MAKKRELTQKQRAWAEAYVASGDASGSARKAGLSPSYARRLVANRSVMAYVRQLRDKITSKKIMTARERQEFWTKVILDEKAEMKDRLKASELLGRASSDFVDRIKHEGDNLKIVIEGPPPPTVEDNPDGRA